MLLNTFTYHNTETLFIFTYIKLFYTYFILYLFYIYLYPCLELGLFMSYLCDPFFIFIFILIIINCIISGSFAYFLEHYF